MATSYIVAMGAGLAEKSSLLYGCRYSQQYSHAFLSYLVQPRLLSRLTVAILLLIPLNLALYLSAQWPGAYRPG